MTISSSLNAGVSGLSANASRLGTISDNIANSSTYGYKRVDTEFSSLVLTPTEGRYAAGGVRTSSWRDVQTQGSLVATSNPTDLALSGRGFIPVTTAADVDTPDANYPLQLTTTGSFKPNDEGYLVSESGLVLLGWPADADGNIPAQPRDGASGLEPVRTNLNQFLASPTTEIRLGANLPAEATQAGASGTPLEITTEYYDNTGASQTLVSTFTPTVPATGQSNEWTMTVTDEAQGGAVVGEFVLRFDDTAGNGGEILSVTANTGAYDPGTGIATIGAASGPIEMEIGAVGSGGVLTQLSAEFAPAGVTRNGAAVGTLTGVSVDESGFVIAAYDSGFTRTIYQVPVVDVPNPDGLEALDNQAFAVSRESGNLFLWDAGDGPTGDFVPFAREQSNADVAEELTALIETQRAYSSNAKIIQTVDEMLQETTNLKR